MKKLFMMCTIALSAHTAFPMLDAMMAAGAKEADAKQTEIKKVSPTHNDIQDDKKGTRKKKADDPKIHAIEPMPKVPKNIAEKAHQIVHHVDEQGNIHKVTHHDIMGNKIHEVKMDDKVVHHTEVNPEMHHMTSMHSMPIVHPTMHKAVMDAHTASHSELQDAIDSMNTAVEKLKTVQSAVDKIKVALQELVGSNLGDL